GITERGEVDGHTTRGLRRIGQAEFHRTRVTVANKRPRRALRPSRHWPQHFPSASSWSSRDLGYLHRKLRCGSTPHNNTVDSSANGACTGILQSGSGEKPTL